MQNWTDESMMIGSEKLLLTLEFPPGIKDRLFVIRIWTSLTWLSQPVGREKQWKCNSKAAAEKVGHKPQYVISDNASIMNKGTRLSGIPHHRDISHTLGMYLERTYKEADDFKAYIKDMANVKFKHNMKKAAYLAYLLPNVIIARFINLSKLGNMVSQNAGDIPYYSLCGKRNRYTPSSWLMLHL
ncbi:MAG: hypothetical protein ACLVEJ_05970 [Parabacteroides sp.]